MTTEDFSAPDVASWIAVLPVAAVEQHGPHLPLGVDAMIGEGYIARAEALILDDLKVTFLPMQRVGTSAEHTAFPGTLSISPDTVIRAWIDIGASVARAGLKKLVLMNSHGGNTAVMDVVARSLRVRHGMLVVTASWQRFGYPDGAFTPEEVRHDIHAGKIETSLMRVFRPDLVRMENAGHFRPVTLDMERQFSQLRASTPAGFGWMAQDIHPSGAIGDAATADPAAGEAAAEHGARAFVELLRDVARFPMERLADGPIEPPKS